MKNFIIILSAIPIILSIILLGHFVKHKMINFKTIILVGLMIFIGVAFIIFIKYYFMWGSDIDLSNMITSSLGIIVFLVVLIISTATNNETFSVRNIIPAVKQFNFPTISLLLYVGSVNLIIFIANIIKYVFEKQ